MLIGLVNGAPVLATAQEQAEPAESSIRMLRRAVTPDRRSGHLDLLQALRGLKDPDLKPFFYQLAQSEDWPTQVQAVLGLGEIDPNHQVDPWLITQVKPETQETVIAMALDLDLLGPERVKELTEWNNMTPMARLFLRAEQVLLKQNPDKGELTQIAQSTDRYASALASLLLAQLGEPAELERVSAQLKDVETSERDSILTWMLQAIRKYELNACLEWARGLLAAPELDQDVESAGLMALLLLKHPSAMDEWHRHLGAEPDYQDRVRFGMLLLAGLGNVRPEAFDSLKPAEDEALLLHMVKVGKAIASGADPTAALAELLDLGHPRTSAWAIDHVQRLPEDQAARVYAHILDQILTGTTGQTDMALAAEATSRLFAIEPQQALDRLQSAEDDSPAQQAILLGLFDTTSPAAGEAAGALRRIGSGRADCIALLLFAKHAPKLEADELRQLGLIACGGGQVSQELQAQAAWLYLKHSGRLEEALAQVFLKP